MKRAKKVVARRLKKTKKKTAVRRKRVVRAKRPIDPFELNPKEMRAKRSYQWVTIDVMGRRDLRQYEVMLDVGWNPVKKGFRWHNKYYDKKFGGIVFSGQLLMERAEKLTDNAKAAEKAKAKAQCPEPPGQELPRDTRWHEHPPASSDDWVDLHTAAKARVKELGGGVPVSIKLALSEREIEAAAICHLTVDQYAERKLKMGKAYGEPPIVLLENDSGIYQIAKLKMEKDK